MPTDRGVPVTWDEVPAPWNRWELQPGVEIEAAEDLDVEQETPIRDTMVNPITINATDYITFANTANMDIAIDPYTTTNARAYATTTHYTTARYITKKDLNDVLVKLYEFIEDKLHIDITEQEFIDMLTKG